jgi:adenine-specific DNA-methyltransferase
MTDIANFNQLELERQSILKLLDAQKDQAARNRLGQFATPPQLAAEIVEASLFYLKDREIRFLDPAFGTGPFYSALLRSDNMTNRHLEAARGFEIDPHYSVSAAQLWANTPLELSLEDFTQARLPASDSAKHNLLICNPPYVRHHHLTHLEKLRLQKAAETITHIKLSGLSGLYCYFMLMAEAWMAPAGLACWLVPAEFMDVNYGQAVRKYLAKNVNLLRIHRFDVEVSQFDDALVSSAVVWFRNERPAAHDEVEFTFGGTVNQPETDVHVDRRELAERDKWNATLHNTKKRQTSGVHISDHEQVRFSDLFHIKRGLATGDNSFFIMPASKALEYGIPREFLKPVLPSPRHLHTDLIEAEATGWPQLPNRLALLDCALSESEIQVKHPQLWKYLQTGIERRVHETYLCRHRNPWYSQEQREPAPILCTYMGRVSDLRSSPFRFVLNSSKATATNTYLLIYPTSRLAALNQLLPEVLRIIWQELNLIPAEQLTNEGRAYGGGLHKLEPSELANLPLDRLLHKVPILQETLIEQLSLWD